MNLTALIPLIKLFKDSGAFSPAARVPFPFQPITLPTLTSEEAGKIYIAGGGGLQGAVMTWIEWSSKHPGRSRVDYAKYITGVA